MDPPAQASKTGAASPTVVLEGVGCCRGDCKEGVARFLGLPYALPPVGSLRWKPPEPPEPFSGVRANPEVLSRCPQPSFGHSNPDEERPRVTFEGHRLEDNEDCLVLNVFAPEASVTSADSGHACELTPVVFYIHGGGGKFGSCHGPHLTGQKLVQSQSVCYVAANYRLGIFGFLAHPELSAEDLSSEGEVLASGNYALLDLTAALKWVRRHISSFGGDPHNVTVWGFSTGAQLAGCLLVSPVAQGLFHRMFIQSCVDLVNSRALESGSNVWLDKSAEAWGQNLAEILGCSQGKGQVAAMRKLSAVHIANHTMVKHATDCYEPALDTRLCEGKVSARPCLSSTAIDTGAFNKVPLMIGVTEQDGLGKSELELTQFEEIDVKTLAGLDALLEREFSEAKEAKQHYPIYPSARPVSKHVYLEQFLGDLSKDLWYNAATWHFANTLADKSSPTYLYVFTEKVSSSGLSWEPDISTFPSSFHGSDAVYWNGTRLLQPCPVESNTKDLIECMMTYLGNFARTGNPNSLAPSKLPTWEAHTCGSMRYMELGPRLGMQILDQQSQRRNEFIERYFNKQLMTERLAKRRKT